VHKKDGLIVIPTHPVLAS